MVSRQALVHGLASSLVYVAVLQRLPLETAPLIAEQALTTLIEHVASAFERRSRDVDQAALVAQVATSLPQSLKPALPMLMQPRDHPLATSRSYDADDHH